MEGYTIYVVRGTFPEIFVDRGIRHWIPEPTTGGQNKTKQPEHYYSLKDPITGGADDELARAIAASLDRVHKAQVGGGGNSFQNNYGQDMNGNEDDDLARAIALSIQSAEVDKQAERDVKRRKSTVPSEPAADEANTTTIKIMILTNGKKVGRRFRQSDHLCDIMNWLYITHNTDTTENSKLGLFSPLEKTKFTQENQSLADLGFTGNILLIVDEK